jgi:hypothetical protein
MLAGQSEQLESKEEKDLAILRILVSTLVVLTLVRRRGHWPVRAGC